MTCFRANDTKRHENNRYPPAQRCHLCTDMFLIDGQTLVFQAESRGKPHNMAPPRAHRPNLAQLRPPTLQQTPYFDKHAQLVSMFLLLWFFGFRTPQNESFSCAFQTNAPKQDPPIVLLASPPPDVWICGSGPWRSSPSRCAGPSRGPPGRRCGNGCF